MRTRHCVCLGILSFVAAAFAVAACGSSDDGGASGSGASANGGSGAGTLDCASCLKALVPSATVSCSSPGEPSLVVSNGQPATFGDKTCDPPKVSVEESDSSCTLQSICGGDQVYLYYGAKDNGYYAWVVTAESAEGRCPSTGVFLQTATPCKGPGGTGGSGGSGAGGGGTGGSTSCAKPYCSHVQENAVNCNVCFEFNLTCDPTPGSADQVMCYMPCTTDQDCCCRQDSNYVCKERWWADASYDGKACGPK